MNGFMRKTERVEHSRTVFHEKQGILLCFPTEKRLGLKCAIFSAILPRGKAFWGSLLGCSLVHWLNLFMTEFLLLKEVPVSPQCPTVLWVKWSLGGWTLLTGTLMKAASPLCHPLTEVCYQRGSERSWWLSELLGDHEPPGCSHTCTVTGNVLIYFLHSLGPKCLEPLQTLNQWLNNCPCLETASPKFSFCQSP